jgi:hypothetical protein
MCRELPAQHGFHKTQRYANAFSRDTEDPELSSSARTLPIWSMTIAFSIVVQYLNTLILGEELWD